MDYTTTSQPHDMRIDSRILRHLLQEASDLLEEAQTHALVEKQSKTTASILAQANWRMTATCIWAISELFPASHDEQQAAQLHAPIPGFARADDTVSVQLSGFIMRVNRLHERAQRLDDLSRSPTVSSAPDAEPAPASTDETASSATIISLFGERTDAGNSLNPIEKARSEMRWAMVGQD